MPTLTITSSATQVEAALPERGVALGVTVDGQVWAFAQSGPDDSTLSFAPAIPAGRSVVISYLAVPVTAEDLEEVNAQLAQKATRSELADKADISLLAGKADQTALDSVSALLDLKADASSVGGALSLKTNTSTFQAAVDYLQQQIDDLHAQIGAGSGGLLQTYAATGSGGYFAENYVQ